MTSIHDKFDFIKKVAVCNTSDEIDAIDDDDIRAEVREEDLQSIRDVLDRLIHQARALEANQPYDYVDMSGAAIREHYEETGQAHEIVGLSDVDLDNAGEWALNWDLFWDSIYDAWDYGIANIRAEKQREEKDVNSA